MLLTLITSRITTIFAPLNEHATIEHLLSVKPTSAWGPSIAFPRVVSMDITGDHSKLVGFNSAHVSP